MSEFKKLSQLNKDIELLENAGKIKAAEVLHRQFIKEAQYMMPQMPMMMMPQMMPMMNPMMMARPVAPMATSAPNRPVNPSVNSTPAAVAKPTTAPVAQTGQVTPKPITYVTNPPTVIELPQPPVAPPVTPPAPPTNKEIKPPYSGSVPPPTQPPTNYGNQQNKNNELQYLESELQRLQREHGMDCGPFAAQCNTLRQMIEKNKGGSVIKG
jgi:hypothetical protein